MLASEVDIKIKTLSRWPEKDPFSVWKVCHFKTSPFKTQHLLRSELAQVEARKVILYTMHRPRDTRVDGWVKMDRAPQGAGVILEFEKPALVNKDTQWVKLRFPCRTFEQWEDNLRAIALALEALRKIDRYGVTTGAQYAGYKALPPAEEGSEGQSPEQAAEFIAKAAQMPEAKAMLLTNPAFAELVYKTAAKELHPDKGGDEKEFKKLEGSMRLVRESYLQAQGAGGGA